MVMGVLAGMVLAEAFVRFFILPDFRSLQQDIVQRHPLFGHMNAPNLAMRQYTPLNYDTVVHTNAMGFRGREADREKELNGIWMGGDSNAFAGGVADEETYAFRLRAHGFWAANISVNGHSLAQQALVIRDTASKGYRPKAVAVTLSQFLGYKPQANYRHFLTDPLAEIERSGQVEHNTDAVTLLTRAFMALVGGVPKSWQDIRARLIGNSAIYGYLKIAVLRLPALRDWTKRVGLRADVATVFGASPDLLRPMTADNPAYRTLEEMADMAAAMQHYVRDRLDAPFGILLAPSYHQMNPQSFETMLRHKRIVGDDLSPDHARLAFVRALRARGVPVLDLLEPLKASGVRPLSFPDDGHMTPTAHRVAAPAIAAWLKDELGVEPQP